MLPNCIPQKKKQEQQVNVSSCLSTVGDTGLLACLPPSGGARDPFWGPYKTIDSPRFAGFFIPLKLYASKLATALRKIKNPDQMIGESIVLWAILDSNQ